jgi:hypothetical protein
MVMREWRVGEMSSLTRKKGTKRPRPREAPELSPEVREVLKMLRALEDQPGNEPGPEETGNLGRIVITD